MTVINTSPAIHLHAVLPGGLGALPALIGDAIIPWEVGHELAAGHAKDAIWKEIQSLSGILLQAKQVGLLPSVSAAIATLEACGMWIAPELAAKAIRLAGE